MKGLLYRWGEGSLVSRDTCSTFVPEWEGDSLEVGEMEGRQGWRREVVWTVAGPTLEFADIESDAIEGMLALPHNGLRREVEDLYRMQRALSLKKVVRWRDLDAFSAWWNVFFGVCTDFLKVEEPLLFAYANFISYKPLQLKARTKMKHEMKKEGLKIGDQLTDVTPANFTSTFPPIMRTVDGYVARLLTYFKDKETELATCMRKKIGTDIVWEINQRLVDDLKDVDYGYYAIPILTRDLTASQLRMFRRETFSAKRTDKAFTTWWRSVESSHQRHRNTVLDGLFSKNRRNMIASDVTTALSEGNRLSPNSEKSSFRQRKLSRGHSGFSIVSSNNFQAGVDRDKSSGLLSRFLSFHPHN